ncbi:MAG TPA: DNA primase [Gemmatimonadaceae bacterium]|nr:DNA primase [Gemmatimonadaceae bacterium]
MITDETVERVREAADIVQIIGEHVSLKRTGADFRGPCPFHQGTHRNFSVSPKKGIYYCFVCHEGGDVFTFLQKRLGMDWPGAVRYVAEKVGIPVEEVQRRREGPDPRQPLWDVNAAVADWFRTLLWDEEEGRQARDYLALRRVSREVADRFGLGFAPRDPDALRAHFNAFGIEDERMVEAGVLVRREEDGELRARFRNRLIFPILDVAGNHVGFGGRLLGPGEPKYLNSAESPVFSKAKLLYGLHMAKHVIRRDDRVMIVEGYFDVVRLVSAGFDWVVAPLGTALTEGQAALLRRYTTNAFLLYDSDKAGLKATFRSGDELLRHGMAVQVVTLPDGEDPDSFVDKFGGEKLQAQLGQAIDVFERKVQLLERAGWFADLRGKRRALDRLLPTVRATTDPIMRDIYLSRASEAAGVSREVLLRELGAGRGAEEAGEPGRRQSGAPMQGAARPSSRPMARAEDDRRETPPRRTPPVERELVWILVHRPAMLEEVAEQVGPEDLHDAALRAVYAALLGAGEDDAEAVAARLPEETRPLYQALQEKPVPEEYDVARTVAGCISRLRGAPLRRRLREIDGLLDIAPDEQKDALTREKERLQRDLTALGAGRFKSFDSGH